MKIERISLEAWGALLAASIIACLTGVIFDSVILKVLGGIALLGWFFITLKLAHDSSLTQQEKENTNP